MALLRRRVALLAPILLSLATCASVCDPLPDECEDDDNVCDGNVANICDQPVPESRRLTTREDCGASRTCVVLANSGFPTCARNDGPACTTEGALSCRDERTPSQCFRAKDGRLVSVDQSSCFKGLACVDGRCVSK